MVERIDMIKTKRKLIAVFALVILASSSSLPLFSGVANYLSTMTLDNANNQFTPSSIASQVPLRKITIVSPDANSYKDEFAYMAAIPTSVFNFNDTQYISPLIYSSGADSEKWLLNDWINYTKADGGLAQAVSIGDFSETSLRNLQYELGTKIYPRITGTSSADVAAKLAISDWSSSDTAVIAFAKDNFSSSTPESGSISYSFENRASSTTTFNGIAYDTFAPTSFPFTPPSWAGWMEGQFNWTGSEILTHKLIDPQGDVVDYSIANQVTLARNLENVKSPVPLNFWLPVISDGQWIMNITGGDNTEMNCQITYHPGFTHSITVPSNAKWLNVTLTWDNAGTDLNLALIDPLGRLAMWAPAGSILATPGHENIELPYPMAGTWKIIAAWMDATTERNNIQFSWEISRLPTNLQGFLESASNAAVLASLLNVPLLYADEDQIPAITEWALERLGVSTLLLVDPMNIQQTSLIPDLESIASVINLNGYSLVSEAIMASSGKADVVITNPVGDDKEFFAPAAYSAAVHGGPIFSLSAGNNEMATSAQMTWVPYLIGPEIENIYVVNQYENRAENGWYDERIPNKVSMMSSNGDFVNFLSNRGAYNSSISQQVVIVSPMSLIPPSFDRSLQCDFQPGRIPAENPIDASILINRGLLQRYLFMTADSANKALVSMYAYTDGATFRDNNNDFSLLYQIENTTDALESAGFESEMHVGASDVFSQLNTQVSLWSLSTHGTLTLLPRDPPDRPNGLGYISLRDLDSPYGFEISLTVRENPDDGDYLVNPVAYPAEAAHNVIKSTNDLDQSIGDIGSPIVILTACLLGGTEMPLVLMKHGAVAVTASPRTVYFQPAGMLSVILAQKLAAGASIGESLSYGLSVTSSDYANPLINGDPRDYANQQILFGDPSVRLYNPDTFTYVATSDPRVEQYGSHTPCRGAASIAVLGHSAYYPNTLSSISANFDYYEPTNLTDFIQLLYLRETVFVEQDTLALFLPFISSHTSELESFVRNGGVLAVLGVNNVTTWSPWPISFIDSGSGDSVTIVDSNHPLLTTPNTISSDMNYTGYFDNLWENFTILATANTHPIIVATSFGSGKILFTSSHLSGLSRDAFIENILQWNSIPSIILRDISLSQRIIWAGDRVTITMDLSDLVGNPIIGLDLRVWLNASQVEVNEVGSGRYAVLLTGNWTIRNLGLYDVRLHASRISYDSLDTLLQQFILIRPFPWLFIGLFGGVAAIIIGSWVYLKRRHGESLFNRGDKEKHGSRRKSKEERKQQEEEDGKFDPKEFFGV